MLPLTLNSRVSSCVFVFFSRFFALPDLHSFPTRRSSDLAILGSARRSGFASRLLVPDGELFRLWPADRFHDDAFAGDRKSTRLNSSHVEISYAVFCLKKKKSIRLARRLCFGLFGLAVIMS